MIQKFFIFVTIILLSTSSCFANISLSIESEDSRFIDLEFDLMGFEKNEVINHEQKILVKRIILKVKNECGKRYQIRQRLHDELINGNGVALGETAIFFYAYSENNKGTFDIDTYTLLDTNDVILYTSDENGTNINLTVQYKIIVPYNEVAGRFLSQLSFEIDTIE